MSLAAVTTPAASIAESRRRVKPTLVYWHCEIWWPIKDGPYCPMEHGTPIYDDRGPKGRKRRVWMYNNAAREGSSTYCGRSF